MNLNYFTQSTSSDYEQLGENLIKRRLEEFLENIEQKEDGRYRIKIPWIEDTVPQNSNESQSRLRLNILMKKMTEEIRDGYEEIIKDRLRMAVMEEVPKQPSGKRIFYMPHKPVVREEATSTKLRMVFDASAKSLPDAFSINECMNLGPNWIQDKEKWPRTEENPGTDIECIQEELKKEETLFYCAEDKANLKEIDSLLERKTLKGTKRIVAWCLRFSLNCRANRSGEKRKAGPLTTEEIENADKKLIRNAQEQINLEARKHSN